MFGAARPGVRRYPRSSWWFHVLAAALVVLAQAQPPSGLALTLPDNATADDEAPWNTTAPWANGTLLQGLLGDEEAWTPEEEPGTSPSPTDAPDAEATVPMSDASDLPEAMMVADEPWSAGDKDFAQVVFANKARPVKDAILLLREKLRRPDLVVPDDDFQTARGLQVLDRADPALLVAGGAGVVEQGAEALMLDAAGPGAGLPSAGLGHLDDDEHSTNLTGNGTLHGWPMKLASVVEGDLVLGGLMMVHERHDRITCGPIMPQGGIQALEAMLYTLDRINADPKLLPGIKLGAHILDDCDKDTHGLEMAVDFIKEVRPLAFIPSCPAAPRVTGAAGAELSRNYKRKQQSRPGPARPCASTLCKQPSLAV
ncbi:Metabotropic glutamate receptor 2 [Frankliniella fusca]|uniref:Metabotropic glutamate receptor 2 n=1 Tax=Frankliniella fusca TaxID=407009 RepID=A0AAE1LDB1_9NEOP|nr:Metabotropic glutamate receptor 2 [Frankliniella fusca]